MHCRQSYQKLNSFFAPFFCWFWKLEIKTSGKYAGALLVFMPIPFDFSARHNLNISISYFRLPPPPPPPFSFILLVFSIDRCQFQLTATCNDFCGKPNEIVRKIRFCTSFAPISSAIAKKCWWNNRTAEWNAVCSWLISQFCTKNMLLFVQEQLLNVRCNRLQCRAIHSVT